MRNRRKYHSIEQIADSLNAAAQLQKIRNSTVSDHMNRSERKQYLPILSEMLGILSDYSPDKYREPFGSSLERAVQYSNTYRTLKQHLFTSKNRDHGKPEFIQALLLIKPVTTRQHQHFIEKIEKIYRLIKE